MTYHHVPVLKKEVIRYLNPKPGRNFIDCTLGGGGHAEELARLVRPSGKVLGIDLDEDAIKFVKSKKIPNLTIIKDNYKNLKKIKNAKFNHRINGILLDLGLSSAQLESSGRGFSFQKDEELDMRFGKMLEVRCQKSKPHHLTSNIQHPTSLTAKNIINQWPERELIKIFREYGEEPQARKIAEAIVKSRKIKPIRTTFCLSKIITQIKGHNSINKKSSPAKGKDKLRLTSQRRGIHPATRVFQALRIATNNELENLKQTLSQCVSILEPGGRLAIISFHSLEDRIVKNFFRLASRDCLCPPRFPICQCHHKKTLKRITKKPVVPTAHEISSNPRSRSAKLRVAEKI